MALPYVIKILVVSGDPDGVRLVEKTNWTGRGVMFPRSDLRSARQHGLRAPGVYVLLGESDEADGDPIVYIGRSDDVGKRLGDHQDDDTKNFWKETVAFVSAGDSLNQAHTAHLESRLVALAREANRSSVENKTQPTLPPMSASDIAEADGFLAELLTVLPAVGVDFFTTAAERETTERVYALNDRGASGRGAERSDGFVVFKGASLQPQPTPSYPERGHRLRQRLIDNGQVDVSEAGMRLTEDVLFRSPSEAAGCLVGASINGRTAWIDETGQTLKQRQIEETSG